MIKAMTASITSEEDIRKLIESDAWMMQALKATEALNLPDWWIGAGFLRNKVWDTLEGNESKPSRDVDLAYFNDQDETAETDWAYDEQMKHDYPFAKWEVRNQARMHYYDDLPKFTSTEEGIAHWVETATCVGVKLVDGELKFLFCYGIDDLINLTARAVSVYDTPERIATFYNRVNKKGWRRRWPHLTVVSQTPESH